MFRKGFVSLLIAAAATVLLWAGSASAQVRTASLQNGAFSLAQASNESRIALVIGNSAYESNKPLNNPANDAQAVSQLLNTAGFEVVMAFDLVRDVMKQTVEEFAARINEKGPNTVALVYYAGHGLQVDGENYLIPIDAKFQNETDLPDQGLKLADVMAALETVPSKARIVIIDACRNNPFGGSSGGLSIVDAPSGSIVAYSTAPGTEAFDGLGRHSPYAAAFMRTAKTPNLPIEQVFKKVRLLVNESTDSKQTPWESSSLTTDFMFFTSVVNGVAAAPAVLPRKVTVADLGSRPVREAYEVVIAEDSVEYYEEFVRLYPTDPLCDHIRRVLSRRQQMIAWQTVTHTNSPDAYASFVSRFGGIDLARAARRLQERPRLVNIAFPRKGEGRFGDGRFGGGIKIGNGGNNRPVIDFPRNGNGNGNGNGGIKTGPVIGFPQNGQNGGNGNGGRPVINVPQNGQSGLNGQNGQGGQNGQNGGNGGGRPVISVPQNGQGGLNGQNGQNGQNGGNGGNRPVIGLPQNGQGGLNGQNGQGGQNGQNNPGGRVVGLPNGNTGINGTGINGNGAATNGNANRNPVIPFPRNGQVNQNGQVNTNNGQINNRVTLPANAGINPNAGRPVINQANIQQRIQQAPVIQRQPQVIQRAPQIQRQAVQIQRQSFQAPRQSFQAPRASFGGGGGGGGGRGGRR